MPKSFSQLYVKNSRFFLSYFLKKDDWPKAYAGPRLPTLPYLNIAKPNMGKNSTIIFSWTLLKCCIIKKCKKNMKECFENSTREYTIYLDYLTSLWTLRYINREYFKYILDIWWRKAEALKVSWSPWKILTHATLIFSLSLLVSSVLIGYSRA